MRIAIRPSSNSSSPNSSTTTNTTTDSTKAPSINLSATCEKKLREICTDDNLLRVIVDGGGCSGFQYKFEIDSKTNADDVRIGSDRLVVVDQVSLDYCAGATLDYQVELIKSGFRIVGNPKAEQGCSCGVSFALKMD